MLSPNFVLPLRCGTSVTRIYIYIVQHLTMVRLRMCAWERERGDDGPQCWKASSRGDWKSEKILKPFRLGSFFGLCTVRLKESLCQMYSFVYESTNAMNSFLFASSADARSAVQSVVAKNPDFISYKLGYLCIVLNHVKILRPQWLIARWRCFLHARARLGRKGSRAVFVECKDEPAFEVEKSWIKTW